MLKSLSHLHLHARLARFLSFHERELRCTRAVRSVHPAQLPPYSDLNAESGPGGPRHKSENFVVVVQVLVSNLRSPYRASHWRWCDYTNVRLLTNPYSGHVPVRRHRTGDIPACKRCSRRAH
jgi:hypothetical protein